jgi:2-amino-4-hydroxy-6-hydroxymethyldihydropteridine diphosphokinase
MAKAYLGLGGNLGDAKQTLKDAMVCLAQHPQIQITAQSCYYQSAPIEAPGDDYINSVVAIRTELSPLALLRLCQSVETEFGRERPYENAPRTLDIDVLLYDNLEENQADLIIPHPKMTERLFVLLPLLEIDQDVSHPKHGLFKNHVEAVSSQVIHKLQGCHCPKLSGF